MHFLNTLRTQIFPASSAFPFWRQVKRKKLIQTLFLVQWRDAA